MVERLWEINPTAKNWMLSLEDAYPENYPAFPMMIATNGYGVVNHTASNIYESYLRTWVAGKITGEIDGFDLKADSVVYCERLFWGT